MENTIPLFKVYPQLRENIPWIPLGKYPSTVEKLSNLGRTLGTDELWIKRDDLLSNTYGGNKVRKLEFILADAKSRESKTLITVGGLGSNHALALTVHSRNLGFRPVLVFFNQPVTERVRKNLLLDAYFGAEMHYADFYLKLPLIVTREFLKHLVSGNKPLYIPAGGTTPLSTLGYVNAVFELKEQVERGEIPKPDYIFVASGTGGTMAGLILGRVLSGLDTRVIGVRVSIKPVMNRFTVFRLVNKTFDLIKKHSPNMPQFKIPLLFPSGSHCEPDTTSNITLLHNYFGKGYGHVTEKAREAVKIGALEEGLQLEETYSGKAFAAFLDFIKTRSCGVFLFWHTFNSVDLSEIIKEIDYRSLPQGFHKLFTCPLDY